MTAFGGEDYAVQAHRLVPADDVENSDGNTNDQPSNSWGYDRQRLNQGQQ